MLCSLLISCVLVLVYHSADTNDNAYTCRYGEYYGVKLKYEAGADKHARSAKTAHRGYKDENVLEEEYEKYAENKSKHTRNYDRSNRGGKEALEVRHVSQNYTGCG